MLRRADRRWPLALLWATALIGPAQGAVPVPASMPLLLGALGAVAALRRRRKVG